MEPIDATKTLNQQLEDFHFKNKVDSYYNPLEYAWPVHEEYLRKFGSDTKEAFMLGMNPGPWGMAQTGVPFTDPYIARDWMNLPEREVGTPDNERSDRPVQGWESDRKEASGQKLHGFFRTLYGNLEDFFEIGFVANYCPLVMFSEEGTNLTPEDLLKEDRVPLFEACDPYIESLIEFYDPDVLVGIGRFAQRRLAAVRGLDEDEVAYLPHPSPASPIATRDGGDYWRNLVREELEELNLLTP
jgi:single-strand selective monofunctional uracil DNA glycosylase